MDIFKSALPVWEKGREKERHLKLQFKTVTGMLSNATVNIATSGIYQLWVNGQFVSGGPARAGRNHFRIDRININNYLKDDFNTVVIEACGYNINSFAVMSQPAFLQAEILDNDTVVAYTGKDFTARKNPYYYQKTPRYSFQRTFVEGYHIDNVTDGYFTDNVTFGNVLVEKTTDKTIIERFAPYPRYETLAATQIGSGNFEIHQEKPWTDREDGDVKEDFFGFRLSELEIFPGAECDNMVFSSSVKGENKSLHSHQYSVYKFPFNSTGFVKLSVSCKSDLTLYILFDEVLKDNGTVNYRRMGCYNAARYDLCKGEHNIQFFDVFTMQYIQIAVLKGECEINGVSLIEFKHPPVEAPVLKNERLNKIAAAAVENYRQSSVDIFMDCPSRERAGFLCDSFFTARAEHFLTGKSLVEKSFLENYLHEENYKNLPPDMFPMCYPADFYDGNFIPQWAMWLVLLLKEYKQRSADNELVNRFKSKIYGLLSFFSKYENSDGLLEDLPAWNFVEWSKANDFINGVNYPTNMLYSQVLNVAGELYSDNSFSKKGKAVKEMVLKQSFNGEFFVDNAVRENGNLVIGTEITEVCQYYAFVHNIASPETHKKLYDTLLSEFGPERKQDSKYDNIHPAAPFIGFFLRLDILFSNGEYEKLSKNIDEYFYNMAVTTGTLWEHANLSASCCHGFTSYVLCWLGKLAELGY